MLRLVGSLENVSEHPLASAIVAGAKERGASLVAVDGFDSVTGKGVMGTIDGRRVAVGNPKMLESISLSIEALQPKADELRRNGQTVMFVAVDDRPAGLIGVAHPIKASAREAIAALHADGHLRAHTATNTK